LARSCSRDIHGVLTLICHEPIIKTVIEDLRSHWWLVAGGLTAILCLDLLSLYGPQLTLLAAGANADATQSLAPAFVIAGAVTLIL
jgi:hypothetical protein